MHPITSEGRPICPHCNDDDTEIIDECIVMDIAGNTCHLAKCLCGSCGRMFTTML